MDTCNHCKTPDCRALFDAGQLTEIQDPAYYAVHQLSVPCYYLQHNLYSKRGWLEVRKLLAEFLAGLAPVEARRRIARSKDHSWSLTKGPKLEAVDGIEWSFTAGDVRLASAAAYCEDVRRWAQSILDDSRSL